VLCQDRRYDVFRRVRRALAELDPADVLLSGGPVEAYNAAAWELTRLVLDGAALTAAGIISVLEDHFFPGCCSVPAAQALVGCLNSGLN